MNDLKALAEALTVVAEWGDVALAGSHPPKDTAQQMVAECRHIAALAAAAADEGLGTDGLAGAIIGEQDEREVKALGVTAQ